jgi:pimeloyl-ACP methyl ester carboxylesterase
VTGASRHSGRQRRLERRPGGGASSRRERVAYSVVEGRNPLVLFIHGWCCNQSFWRPQMAALGGRLRLAALDLSGHGLSRRAPHRAWPIEAFGADVVAVADALAADQVVLVGHSMGGPVALEASLRLGARCLLVLGVDTFTDVAFYRRLPRDEIETRVQTFAADFAGAMTRMVAAITAPGDEPGLIGWIAGQMTRSDPRIALSALESLLDWDIEQRWPLRRAPIETINSKRSALREAQIPLDGLGVHILDGVGHFPMLEAPEAFNAALLGVLRRHGLDAGRAAGC